MPSPAESQHRKRELRLRIGRLRRQIDRRARAVRQEPKRLFSWRSVVRRLPGNAILAAFGLGLSLAAGLSARSLGRWLGVKMIRHSLRAGQRVLGAELQRIWADSTPPATASRERGRRE